MALHCAATLVVVPVTPYQVDAVLDHLGRAHQPAEHVVVLEIGDDGWALLPTKA
jgi:hypothetical protein